MIPASTKFGPFEGVIRNFLPDQMDVLKKAGAEDSKLFFINESHILDLTDESKSILFVLIYLIVTNVCHFSRYVQLDALCIVYEVRPGAES